MYTFHLKYIGRVGKIAQWVKYLPHDVKDISVDPQDTSEKSGRVAYTGSPSAWCCGGGVKQKLISQLS